MCTQLMSLEEQQKLADYRVCFEEESASMLNIDVIDLFDKEKLLSFLGEVQEELQAPDLMVTGSAFSKRYSYLIIASAFYSFLMFNKKLNISAENLAILSSTSQEKWLPRLFFNDQTAYIPETKEDRKTCRDDLIKELFVDHLSPLWDNISELCKVPKPILWENTAIYLFWIFETLLKRDDLAPELRDTIQLDFDYFLYATEHSIFKDYKSHPITGFYCDMTSLGGQAVRIRKTCCLYYALSEEGKMCKGCPRRGSYQACNNLA
ncbi:MAG: (2Fe-2S)-binding protein [Bacillaceae bacterium]|nr:(2Fe-2S)-binding protein [Bacillaceae bacterium]